MIIKYNRLFTTHCLNITIKKTNRILFYSITGIAYSIASPVIKLILHKPGGRRSLAFIPPNNQSVSSIMSAVCEYLNQKKVFF